MASPVPVAWTSPPSRASVPRPSVSGFLQSLMKVGVPLVMPRYKLIKDQFRSEKITTHFLTGGHSF